MGRCKVSRGRLAWRRPVNAILDPGSAVVRCARAWSASPKAIPSSVAAAKTDEAAALLRAARRPLLIAGEMVDFDQARDELVRFAEATGAGVRAAYRRQDVFPNDHPAWIGQLALNRAAPRRAGPL